MVSKFERTLPYAERVCTMNENDANSGRPGWNPSSLALYLNDFGLPEAELPYSQYINLFITESCENWMS